MPFDSMRRLTKFNQIMQPHHQRRRRFHRRSIPLRLIDRRKLSVRKSQRVRRQQCLNGNVIMWWLVVCCAVIR